MCYWLEFKQNGVTLFVQAGIETAVRVPSTLAKFGEETPVTRQVEGKPLLSEVDAGQA
jgi:hypothetical protein